MTVKVLTSEQKDIIVSQYQAKMRNQKELAIVFHTSERTINRVLIERGLATPVERIKGEAHQVMQLLKKHGLDLPGLKDLLTKQAPLFDRSISREQVQGYLNKCTPAELAGIFYIAGLVKIAEKHNTHVQTASLRMQERATEIQKHQKEFDLSKEKSNA